MRYAVLFAAVIALILAGIFYIEDARDEAPIEAEEYTYENGTRFVDVASQEIEVPSADTLASEGTIYYFTLSGAPNGGASVAVDFTRPGGYPVFNLALDLNSDGKYEAYETANGTQEEWVVRNVPAYVLSGTTNFYDFEVVDTRIYGKRDTFGHGTFTAGPLDATWLREPSNNAKRVRLVTRAYEFGDSIGLNVPGNGPGLYRGAGSFGFFTPAYAAEGPSIPDLDVDLALDIPDYSQSAMECAPTAITNNIEALAKANGKGGDLPDADTMIDQLKNDLRFGDDGRDGVLDRNYIAGKNAFMRRYNLPVVTTEITNPSFDDIADALMDGAVIEMDLAFFEVAGSATRHVASHVVTVTGISSDGGEFSLRGRDSATPEGNESWQFFPKYEGQPQSQLFYPKWRKGATIINKIYIQRWVGVDEAIAAGVLSPGTEGSTYEIEVLRIGTGYYPKQQFTEAGPDACDGGHYHKASDAIGLKFKDRRDLISISDPKPNECGFGKVGEVPVETIRIDWYQQQALAGALSTP